MRFKNIDSTYSAKRVIDYLLVLSNIKGKTNIFRKYYSDNYSDYYDFVFLCGGNYDQFSSRDVLSTILKKNPSIQIIISEELQELRGSLDLFSFEILLEAISKMVLISLESMGTACELGAFTNSQEGNKEVVIVNADYKNDESFINKGPIEYLKNGYADRVIYTSFGIENGKHCIVVNSDIANLYNHCLITSPIVFNKCFAVETDENGKRLALTIIDLTTFSAYILDYFFVFYYGNVDSIIYFLKQTNNVKNIQIKSSGLKGKESVVRDVIRSLIRIYVRTNILEDKGTFFYVSLTSISQTKQPHSWVGRIIFLNEFVKSSDYQKIKLRALAEYRRLIC